MLRRSLDIRKLVKALRAAKLRPLDAQHVVWDERARVATGIDITCEHVPSGSLVLCELKCGYNGGTHDLARGSMRAPLSNVSDCPRNQHQLQAACGELMFKRCTRVKAGVAVDSRVIRVCDEGVHFEALEAWAREAAPVLMEKLTSK